MSLPTGYGKSICYAILPSVFDRIKGRCMVCVIEYLQSSSPFCMHNYRVHWKYCLIHFNCPHDSSAKENCLAAKTSRAIFIHPHCLYSDVTATLNQIPVQEIPGPVETKPLWEFDQTLSQRSDWVKGLARETILLYLLSCVQLRFRYTLCYCKLAV